MESDLNWLISVDDHLIEPPHLWQTRVSSRFRDAAPRWVTEPNGGGAWMFDGQRIPLESLGAAAGNDAEDYTLDGTTFDRIREGCYEPLARVADMDQAGILSSLCFPTLPRFCGPLFSETKNRDLGLECVKAYNDFMIDEWAGSAPGRLIPLMMIPLWDTSLAVAEIERCAAKGAKAVTISENFSKLGWPSIHDKDRYWDPVLAKCEEIGMPICLHLGSSSSLLNIAPDAPMIVSFTASIGTQGAITCIDWMMSGVLDRFPRLKVCLSEGGISWIPGVLEYLEYSYTHSGAWARHEDVEYDAITKKFARSEEGYRLKWDRTPKQVFQDQFYGCFIDESFGAKQIELIGVDNVMIETDYPHSDSTWPRSIDRAHENLAHLSKEDQFKVIRGNAERVFDFTPAAPPVLA